MNSLPNRIAVFAGAVSAILCAGNQARASFLGATVDLQYNQSDYGSMLVGLNGASYTLPPFDVTVGGPAVTNSTAPAGSVIILNDFASGDIFTGTFIGPEVSLLTPGQEITGATIDPQSFTSFTPQISYTSDSISINLTGLSTATSPTIQVDVQFAAAVSTPEPQFAVVGVVVLGFVGLRRNRRRSMV